MKFPKPNFKEDKDHKNRKIVLLILTLFLFFVMSVILIVGVRVNFLINDELNIILKPLDKHLITTYGKNANITFEFENSNIKFCSSECSYQFLDLSKNYTIDQETLIMPSQTKITKSYELEPTTYGAGQQIYSFQVKCKNIRNLLCATDGNERFRSSFITLSYDLSEEERFKLLVIKDELGHFLKELRLADIKSRELNYLFNRAFDSLKNTLFKKDLNFLDKEIITINSNMDSLKSQSNVMLGLWDSDQYTVLLDKIKSNNMSLNQASNNIVMQDIKLKSLILDYNSLIYNITELNEKSRYIGSIIYYYSKNNVTDLENKSIETRNDITYIDKLFYNASNNQESLNNKVSGLIINIDNLIDIANTTLYKSNISLVNITLITISDFVNQTFNSSILTEVKLKEPTCCVFGKCKTCCTTETCYNDPRLYPIILIHGHAFNERSSPELSLNSFADMQRKLQEEGIINAGQLDLQNLESVPYGEYGKSGNPISIRATYYYINFYDVAGYRITTQKSERIENYALRLNEIVNVVKQRTGADKVNIVAHSMGGLVAREYIRLFGENNVDKLILVATPNFGISGNPQKLCDFLGSGRECQDMEENSIFLKRLNQAFIPDKVKLYNIAAIGCDMDNEIGDGIVRYKSVLLGYAKNFNLTGTCTDPLNINLHQQIIEPALYPETYKLLINILKE